MPLQRVSDLLADQLFSAASNDVLFNPYRDEQPDVDRPGAASIRRDNLQRYISNYRAAPDVLIMAEAPGPWGCRFSGVPITSEAQLVDVDFPVSGRQSSLRSEPYKEYSAGIFWRALRVQFPRFFVWNCVPLHPHPRSKPLAIRTPTAAEIRQFASLTRALIEALRPERILALGRKAEKQMSDMQLSVTYIRHPSQGGARLFEKGIRVAMPIDHAWRVNG